MESHGLAAAPPDSVTDLGTSRKVSRTASVRPRVVVLVCASAAVAAARFAPVVARMVQEADFPDHTRFAQALLDAGQWQPHFGYHLFVIAAHLAIPQLTWAQAAQVVTLGGVAAAAAVLAWWLENAGDERAAFHVVAAALPIALLTVQPILLVSLTQDRWLIGYFPPNQWHSPTTLFSKAPALALFLLGARALTGTRASARAVWACAGLAVLSVVIKPNFLMAFVPALVVAGMFRRDRSDWRLIGAGVAAPTVLILAAQFMVRYVVAQQPESMTFSPLYVIGLYSPTDSATLTGKFVASVLFPLTVAICFPGALRGTELRLAWLLLFWGVSYGYLLAEGGQLADHGNFLWSGQLAVFVLFAASAVHLVRRLAATRGRAWSVWARATGCAAVLSWHVASGTRHFTTSWLS